MHKEHAEQVAVLSEQVNGLKEDVHDLSTDVKALVTEIARYKGFMGGVFFVVSCIVTAIGAWFSWK